MRGGTLLRLGERGKVEGAAGWADSSNRASTCTKSRGHCERGTVGDKLEEATSLSNVGDPIYTIVVLIRWGTKSNCELVPFVKRVTERPAIIPILESLSDCGVRD